MTQRLDLAPWSDCWVSVKTLLNPIPRKKLNSTITTFTLSLFQELFEYKWLTFPGFSVFTAAPWFVLLCCLRRRFNKVKFVFIDMY